MKRSQHGRLEAHNSFPLPNEHAGYKRVCLSRCRVPCCVSCLLPAVTMAHCWVVVDLVHVVRCMHWYQMQGS